MTYFYGYNPSGGAHRYTEDIGLLEFFDLATRSWVPVDWTHYAGWLEWRNLADMSAEVREVECQSWVNPDPEEVPAP